MFFWDEPHLIQSFTCREMVEYWIALHQPQPRPGLSLHVLEQLNLAELADRVVSSGLSDGERRYTSSTHFIIVIFWILFVTFKRRYMMQNLIAVLRLPWL